MIDETKQELAAAYVLGALDTEESVAFAAELETNAELRALVSELEETAAQMAQAAPAVPLPPALREKVLASVRGESAPASIAATSSAAPSTPVQSSGLGFLPWAVAAGFAITAGALWMERNALNTELVSLKMEATELRSREVLNQVKIATLEAKTEAFAKGTAVVVWDPEKQQGVIKLTGVPPPEAGKDYQLWIVDPKYPNPVSGGIVPVGSDGMARLSFTPEKSVRKANAFAISIEQQGGVPVAAGPIVLVGGN